MINCSVVLAYAPGDGIYDPNSSDFYNAGRELNQEKNIPNITPEFSQLIEEKEATLYHEDGSIKGTADYNHLSHMPGYTTSYNVGHWVAIDGYKDDGNTIWIVDPINGCSAISWNTNVSKYYSITLSKFTAFVAPRGIFW